MILVLSVSPQSSEAFLQGICPSSQREFPHEEHGEQQICSPEILTDWGQPDKWIHVPLIDDTCDEYPGADIVDIGHSQ